jgi:EmrB/QacA subfamily drug resistance transporter
LNVAEPVQTPTPAPAQPIGLRSLPRKQIIITFAGVMLAMFLGSLDQTVVGTAMPRIIADLGGFTQYTWLTTAYIITSAVAVPITGKLTDLYGRKTFYLAGLCIFIGASILCGLSNTMGQIIIFRGVQGIGAGVMMANAFTVIGDLFPPAVRGKYQGIMSGVFGLSSIIGPMLGGYVTDTLSWHWVFFINVPLGLAVILLFIFFFPNFRPDRRKHSIDYAGVSLLILTVVPMMLALSWGGVEYAWGSTQIIGMFVFSGAALLAFLFVESHSPEPIIPLALFRNRVVSVSLVLIFLTGGAMFGSVIFVPLFIQGVLGKSATASGSFITPMMLGMVTGSLISGQLLSRAGGHYRTQGTVGIMVMAIGMFLLSRMGVDTSSGTAIRNMAVTGFGLGITMPLYTIAVQNAVPYNILGVATSSTAFFRSIGGSVGLAVFGSVMNNRFATDFIARLPDAVRTTLPAQQLDSLAHNPEALMSAEVQTQLQNLVGQIGDQGAVLMQQVMDAVRQALAGAIGHVFLYAMFAVLLAFVINFFIREVPLRREHSMDAMDDGHVTKKPE